MDGNPISGNAMPSLDTNCLLRWLLGDIPEQTDLITDILDSGESVVVSDVALIETVFVLEKLKKIKRESIEKAMKAIIGKENILCSQELFIEVFMVYSSHPKLSFVDCYLEALARKTGAVPLLTFDK